MKLQLYKTTPKIEKLFSKENSLEENSIQDDTIRIALKNSYLNVEKGEFEGSLELAQEAIQAFLDKNVATYTAYGQGFGLLQINDATREITPYGIDIPMMLEFCGIDQSTLSTQMGMK
ncbi:hypothetical protein OQJ26_13140 [Legionella sp. PATHC038]|uniref:hypothetical protein n=1 Tax=Legionella sheltonii TaxID=2992041 RepID=UPI002242FD05|nr:hypothetical protein [Legionella sp. PATHC038]MCW8399735.1 hypothetical protein [Legionella sp. PATHC038]